MKLVKYFVGMLVALAVSGSSSAFAAETKAANTAQDEKMAQVQKYATPGENHKRLDPFVGNFKTTVKMWMEPGKKPEITRGTSESRWIFGNRFVQTEYKGQFQGQAFEGIGYIGYDNVRAEYTSTWLDNMGTGIMHGTGQYNAATKSITEQGTFSCPMSGDKNKNYRATWKPINANRFTYSMYTPDKNGKEFKTMEITYDRIK